MTAPQAKPPTEPRLHRAERPGAPDVMAFFDAATSSIKASQSAESGEGSTPFSRRNTIAAAMPVRLLPSVNAWFWHR